MKTDFKTDDISLTAFLLTKGMVFTNVLQSGRRHFVFVLSDTEKCLELKRAFFNNAMAPAQELFSKRDMLITEIKNKNAN